MLRPNNRGKILFCPSYEERIKIRISYIFIQFEERSLIIGLPIENKVSLRSQLTILIVALSKSSCATLANHCNHNKTLHHTILIQPSRAIAY